METVETTNVEQESECLTPNTKRLRQLTGKGKEYQEQRTKTKKNNSKLYFSYDSCH